MNKNVTGLYEALKSMGAVRNVPMSEHTSFKIGGAADIMLIPKTDDELKCALKAAADRCVPVFIMGNGTNLLVSDKGIRGLVIKLKNDDADIKVDKIKNEITCSADLLLTKVAKSSLDNDLKGLEWACGIPGTLGGAVAMNAGAYGGEIADRIKSIELISLNGDMRIIKPKKDDFGYRYSAYSFPKEIVRRVVLSLECDDGSAKELANEYTRRRKEKQPLAFPSAGSTFKRPKGAFAGSLIEKSGLKGFSVGGAQVSELHAGFIINKGGGKAKDVLELISVIQEKVYKDSGFMLETEVKFVGEE